MRKELSLFILATAISGATTMLHAQSSKVKVIKTDGSTTEMGAGTIQRIEIGTNTITVVPNSGEKETINLADLKGLSFGSFVFNGIGEVISNDMKVWPVSTSDKLNISGVPAGTAVTLYGSNGAKVAAAKSNGGTTTFNVNALPDGVYVIKVGGYASKFIKK